MFKKDVKITLLFVIGAFIVTSINSLSAPGDPITREEATEISKNSVLVIKGMANSYSFEVEARYYNSSLVEQLKKGHNRETYEKVPVGRSVWQVVYSFRRVKWLSEGPTAIVIIDAELGIIIHEEWGVYLL